MLTEKDLAFIRERGVSQNQIEQQIEQFKKGFPDLNIVKPAIINDGVKKLSENQLNKFVKIYKKASRRLKRVKFVPASGAATRMFKHLFKILHDHESNEGSYLNLIAEKDFNSAYYMCQNLKKFAFYQDLVLSVENSGSSIGEISKNKDFPLLLKTLLENPGLNYSNLPKGLLKFHKTGDEDRTPVHEHLIEGINYAKSGKLVNLHFTVSSNHIDLFQQHINTITPKLQKEHKVKIEVSFSVQKPSTDTVAVDLDNCLVYDENENLVFRPGGHGALINNLNEIDADLIFVKNIDNVVQDRLKDDTIHYKKALAGIVLSVRKIAEVYFKKLNKRVKDDLLLEVEEFVKKKLFVITPDEYSKWDKSKKIEYLLKIINRPIRVCGMVRNEDEPGGGPFWVKASDGTKSLQIVESSQFSDDQKNIMLKSTHFNPVDLVCSTKDFKGNKYNLLDFVDNETGFISAKSISGKDIKAIELPGLWNGAMANWNTIFIEVPASTFNPVKTLNDLLRTEHLFENDLLQNDDNEPCIID